MGIFSRKDELRKNAAKHIGPGEEIRESVIVRKGALRQQNHALVVTDESFYAFRLGWPGFSRVEEKLLELPIGQIWIEQGAASTARQMTGEGVTGKVIVVGPDGERHEWARLTGRNPEPLIDFINSRRTPA